MAEQFPTSETEVPQEVVEALREGREDAAELLGAWIDTRPESPEDAEAAVRHRITTYHMPLAEIYDQAKLYDAAWETWQEAREQAELADLPDLVQMINDRMLRAQQGTA